MRVIVVGGGIMGLSAAWGLARAGARVTVLEQGALPNPLGSSVDEHRLIRHPYGAEEGYTRMIEPAFRAWAALWEDLGEVLYERTGTLALQTPGATWTAASREVLRRVGVPCAALSPDEVGRRWPWLVTDDLEEALYLDGGGALLAGPIVGALARWLGGRADVVTEAEVVEVDAEAGRVALASGATLSADAVVVAAGPWAARLLPELAPRLVPSRQVVGYLTPPAALQAAWGRAPMLLDIGAESGFYAVPPVRGTGLKVADHTFSMTGDPDRDRDGELAELGPVLAAAGRRLRGFDDYRLTRIKTCFYTVAPEERFVVERRGRSVVMGGFSGHGFKFGALMGLAVASVVRGEADAADLAAWAAGQEVGLSPGWPLST